MAWTVFHEWGIRSSEDFGAIVFTLVGDTAYVAGTLQVDGRGGKQAKRSLAALVHDQVTLVSAVETGRCLTLRRL